MKFNYTALTANNQKIEGLLESDSRPKAQDELHKMDLAILSLNEISEEEYEKAKTEKQKQERAQGIKTFFFKARDPHKKPIEGTIDAAGPEIALRRLMEEYQLEVSELYGLGASPEEIEKSKEALPPLKTRIQNDLAPSSVKKNEEEEPTVIDEEVKIEIDTILQTAKKNLIDYDDLFSNEKKRSIEQTLGELERIRTSNNLKHITEVSNELLKLIGEPDRSEGGPERQETYRQTLKGLEKSSFLNKGREFNQKLAILAHLNHFVRQLKKTFPRFAFGKTPPPEPPAVKHAPAEAPQKGPGFKKLWASFRAYLAAKNQLSKERKKFELMKAWKEWWALRNKKEEPSAPPVLAAAAPAPKPKHDFTPFFFEIDSFAGWLLFFYLLYFFAVDFSLDKQGGLKTEWVLKTIKSPLLMNLAFFLFISHLLLRFKLRHFRNNIVGSLFLFFFGYGVFILVIFNF